MFSEFSGTGQTAVGPDGSKKSTYTGVSRFTGGMGRYQGVRGVVKDNVIFDLDKNTNQLRSEGEYWIEK